MQSATNSLPAMPRTRFVGSKRKLAGWIGNHLAEIEFHTVLDAFGGTGSVAYELKRRDKSVTYNDLLRFNFLIGRALIENRRVRISPQRLGQILTNDDRGPSDDFIERTFAGIYFTDEENRWIDRVWHNIRGLADPHEHALACYALFQSALAKRPYNLFHRRNLYMRTAGVARSFGNKATWDRPFDDHFRNFAAQANRAVFDNGQPCRALNRDALEVEGSYDLVYIDPPYVAARKGGVDYRSFYHFLEGLTDYDTWCRHIDWSSRHRRLRPRPDPWSSPSLITAAFDALFARFAESLLIVSYRSDGIPSVDALRRMLQRYRRRVRVACYGDYQYALSTNRRSQEVLLIGT